MTNPNHRDEAKRGRPPDIESAAARMADSPQDRCASATASAQIADPSQVFPQWITLVALIVVATFLFGWRVNRRGMWSSHEGRAAQNAQSMLDTGQWLLPTLYSNDPEYQKPPLYYWMVAGLSVPGDGQVTALTVRAPSTLCAILGLVVVFLFGRRLWDWETGVVAAVILASTTRYAWLARVGRIDMPLTVVCLISLFSFWLAVRREEQRSRLGWGFYVAVAVGVLLKGPVAVVLIGLPIGVYLWIVGCPFAPGLQAGWSATWTRFRLLPGIALVALLTVPWFTYAIVATDGEFFWRFFYHHNISRALGASDTLKSGPFWFYVPRLFVDCFPWSVLLPAVGVTLWRARARLRDDDLSRSYLFLLTWIGTQFALLSLVSFKRPDYLAPVFPALALLLAGWMRDRFTRFERRLATHPGKRSRRRARFVVISAYLLAACSIPLLIWGIVAFLKKGIVPSILEIDPLARHLNSTDRFMMGHVERLLQENWPLLAIGFVVMVGCIGLFHIGWHNRRNRRMIASLAAPWAVCYLFQVHLFLPALDPLREMSRFGEKIRTLASRDEPIYYFGKFDPDLVFHAGKPARLVGQLEDVVKLGESPEPRFVVMKEEFHKSWVATDPRSARWRPIADNRETPFGDHRDVRVLLTNQRYELADQPSAGSAPGTRSF